MSITLNGILDCTGNLTFSGSSVDGAGVTGIGSSGSSLLINNVYLTGSGGTKVSQTGQIITISGSTASSGVTGIAYSGSSLLTGNIYLTGSGGTQITQSGQFITVSGSEAANSGVLGLAATGSSLLTGSIYLVAGNNINISQSGQFITITGSNSSETISSSSGSVGPYSYIVYSGSGDGGPYFAKDSDGILRFSGSGGTTVLASCVGAGNSIAIMGEILGRIEMTATDMTLIGVANDPTIKLPNGVDDNVVEVIGSGLTNCKVLNLKIDGNKAGNSLGSGLYVDTDYVSTDTGHVFQNLLIVGTSEDGVKVLADTRVSYFSNIYIGGGSTPAPEGKGFNIAGTDHHFVNCEVGFAAKSGWYIKTTNTKFTNCKGFACGTDNTAHDRAQFSLVGVNAGAYNSLTNCHAQDGKYMGFELYNGARDNTFVNCHADDNGQTADADGFVLDTDCVRNDFVGCRAFDYASTHMTNGFKIINNSNFNKISSTYIWNGQNNGILISGSDYNYIASNFIYSNGEWGISIETGSSNRIGDNFYNDNTSGTIKNSGSATEIFPYT